jgi:chromosome segregation ATPase
VTTTTIDDLERRIADLREQHAAALEAVEQAEADLAPLDEKLAEARAVYDEVGRAMVTAQRAYVGPSHDPYETHHERSPAEYEQARLDARDAETAFQQADQELGAALVRRNTVDGRRGSHVMHARRIEAAIAEAERDLDRARQALAAPQRDLLAKIRARVLGGAA